MLILGIHMDNELLYCGIENQTLCLYSSLYLSIFLSFTALCLYSSFYLSIFLSFTAKFVSQFSPELCKLESSNMVYICRMSDCIVVLTLRDMVLFFYFYPFFFLSLIYLLTLKFCVLVFSGIFKATMLKLGIHMDNELLYDGIENQTPCTYSSLYFSIFIRFYTIENLCFSFLCNLFIAPYTYFKQ